MEVVDSPLNLAHQQSRKADRLLAAGKYEEAISCHGKAAELLREAMKLTECEQARLSMELQRDSHVKQQRLVEERWKRFRREPKPPRLLQASSSADHASSLQPQPPGGLPHTPPDPSSSASASQYPEREYDTLLYQLKHRGTGGPPAPPPCAGSKAHKDDKTRLEEQHTTIVGLRGLVDQLMGDVERLKGDNRRLTRDNERLTADNARLRRDAADNDDGNDGSDDTDSVEQSELWVLPPKGGAAAKEISIPQLPPLEMPTQDIPLEDLPALELPEDIQNELRELMDRDEL